MYAQTVYTHVTMTPSCGPCGSFLKIDTWQKNIGQAHKKTFINKVFSLELCLFFASVCFSLLFAGTKKKYTQQLDLLLILKSPVGFLPLKVTEDTKGFFWF